MDIFVTKEKAIEMLEECIARIKTVTNHKEWEIWRYFASAVVAKMFRENSRQYKQYDGISNGPTELSTIVGKIDVRHFSLQSEKVQALLESMIIDVTKRGEEVQGRGINGDNGDPNTNPPFVNLGRLETLRNISASKFDLSRLVRLCKELNLSWKYDCFCAVVFLTRAILDHVPPIFDLKLKTFAQVIGQHGGKSFKEQMEYLHKSARKIADEQLHLPIRSKESLPNRTQVNFSNALDVLLAEIERILK